MDGSRAELRCTPWCRIPRVVSDFAGWQAVVKLDLATLPSAKRFSPSCAVLGSVTMICETSSTDSPPTSNSQTEAFGFAFATFDMG